MAGAGTTAAKIRAGVPSVIIPFGGDQPFWGKRVYKMGIGTKPIWCNKLSVENFSEAINIAVTDEAMRKRASEYGKKPSAEDGVSIAIAIIESSLKILD